MIKAGASSHRSSAGSAGSAGILTATAVPGRPRSPRWPRSARSALIAIWRVVCVIYAHQKLCARNCLHLKAPNSEIPYPATSVAPALAWVTRALGAACEEIILRRRVHPFQPAAAPTSCRPGRRPHRRAPAPPRDCLHAARLVCALV
eukprot:2086604-Pleurochrysis_carterae.AAC.2